MDQPFNNSPFRIRSGILRVIGPCCIATILACGAFAQVSPDPLDELARKVSSAPEDLLTGDALRRLCRERKVVTRCIELFDKVAAAHPRVPAVRYNAALAYVDELPGHSLLVQARLSTHSIEHVSTVLEQDPTNWLALYIRGLNNLYWPLWYHRTDRALADLGRCIELTRGLPIEQRRPYMTLAYLALGDTYVRREQINDALEVWNKGMDFLPSDALRERLRIPPAELHDRIEKIRSRDVSIDTDLTVFSAPGPSNPIRASLPKTKE